VSAYYIGAFGAFVALVGVLASMKPKLDGHRVLRMVLATLALVSGILQLTWAQTSFTTILFVALVAVAAGLTWQTLQNKKTER
jgi:hypothetical protein